jgi:hypothetical protein
VKSFDDCNGGRGQRGSICACRRWRTATAFLSAGCSGTPEGTLGYALQPRVDPASYLERIRAEVPAYDELQDAVAEATVGIQTGRVSSSAS